MGQPIAYGKNSRADLNGVSLSDKDTLCQSEHHSPSVGLKVHKAERYILLSGLHPRELLSPLPPLQAVSPSALLLDLSSETSWGPQACLSMVLLCLLCHLYVRPLSQVLASVLAPVLLICWLAGCLL